MTDEDVRRACTASLNALFSGVGVQMPIERGTPSQHITWMLGRTVELMNEGRREKAMRWLGFVQGYLWANGLAGVDEMKDWNRQRADVSHVDGKIEA